ncbi:hypothetical protein J2S43_001946 [Catenuloplanes nepalensis]|uniref:Uncharacterized protein n=1 Tax=Catenuloplanes nepalensis TaxID=587533 RepID=A0ABT9MPT0_9ACTN|nr:hypothetical protein [Catenuloplanes nepalensis]MDP9793434.1 hypothetical protein [Catenuloplanes nepalensis]
MVPDRAEHVDVLAGLPPTLVHDVFRALERDLRALAREPRAANWRDNLWTIETAVRQISGPVRPRPAPASAPAEPFDAAGWLGALRVLTAALVLADPGLADLRRLLKDHPERFAETGALRTTARGGDVPC